MLGAAWAGPKAHQLMTRMQQPLCLFLEKGIRDTGAAWHVAGHTREGLACGRCSVK